MALNDIRIVDTGGRNTIPTYTWVTAVTTLVAGDLVGATTGSPTAIIVVDGEGTTTQSYLGVVATPYDSVTGTVEVYMPLPGIIYETKATTSTNVNTAAKIAALVGDAVTFDVSGTTITIDENAGHTATNAALIVGGDPVRGTLKWMLRDSCTVLGHATV